jgi:hypothetical protein
MADENKAGDEAGSVSGLEQALASLKPSRSQIDRDRFLYLAGKVAAEAEHRPSRFATWAWPASTFVSTAAAVVLLTLLVGRPAATRSGAIDRSPTVAGSIDAASTKADVASRTDNSAANERSTEEFVTETSPSPLADVAALDSGTPLNSLRLRYGQLESKAELVTNPAPASRGPLALSPSEPAPTQREMLREFLKADRLAQSALENRAG